MGESLYYLLQGISVSLILGENGSEKTITLRCLAYLIYTTVKSLHATLPPHQPFPPELTEKALSRINICNLIRIKKSDSTNHSTPPTQRPPKAPYNPSLELSSPRTHSMAPSFTMPSNITTHPSQ
jgi:hypothetical protein